MTYQEVLANARTCMGPYCKACPICNGVACKNTVPGPGAKGLGTGAIRNYQKWQELCVNMDTICENTPVDTSCEIFGRKFVLPVFAAPIGAMKMHYGDKYDDAEYNDVLVSSCAQAGIAAFTGDGTVSVVMEAAAAFINAKYGEGTLEIAIKDSYYNMKGKIEPVMHIIDAAKKAMADAGVTPKEVPIRGGTDGARLSYEGLPCPNLFTGGENFHGRFEYIPVEDMEASVRVLKNILRNAVK